MAELLHEGPKSQHFTHARTITLTDKNVCKECQYTM